MADKCSSYSKMTVFKIAVRNDDRTLYTAICHMPGPPGLILFQMPGVCPGGDARSWN